jgi:release factor glutamine methyltransferase
VDAISPADEPLGLTVRDALRWATRALRAGGCGSPRLDAEVLLAHTLGAERPQLHLRWDQTLSPALGQTFTALVQRRMAHEPVAYLVGQRAFYDISLRVDARVLIPRPESEHLIEEALRWAAGVAVQRVADVGTGSGALAVTLARHLPHARVWATDRSLDALRLARENAVRYGLEARLSLVCCSLLSALAGPFDLIVANLPYVRRDEIPTLMPDVAAYEPHLALDGGPDGLRHVERLLAEAPSRLARPGLLLLEIDPRQAERVVTLASAQFAQAIVAVLPDLAGLERVVRVALPATS